MFEIESFGRELRVALGARYVAEKQDAESVQQINATKAQYTLCRRYRAVLLGEQTLDHPDRLFLKRVREVVEELIRTWKPFACGLGECPRGNRSWPVWGQSVANLLSSGHP